MEVVTYVVPAENRATIEKKLDQLNKKAAKLGTTPISMTFEHDRIETWRVEKVLNCPEYGYIEYSREWLKVYVLGAVAEVNGYYFRAALYHTTEGNIIAAVPGYEVPRAYRNAAPVCNHCGAARLRSSTYLIESKDGLMQVGRNCLADFTGANDPHKLAKWAEAIGAFDSWFQSLSEEEGGHGPRPETQVELEEFVRRTAAVIRMDGWTSKKVANETERTATVSTVWFVMNCRTREVIKENAERYGVKGYIEDDEVTATKVLAWATETLCGETEPDNDYLHNLAVITRAGLVSHRTSGLAGSMIAAWRRATQKQEERENAPASVSTYVGKEKERLRGLRLTISAVIELEATDFGPRRIIKMTDEAGNDFAWFTGSFSACEPGDLFDVTGTVKRHSEYKGMKQTELGRCVMTLLTPAPVEVA